MKKIFIKDGKKIITVIRGDGIGPEVVDAALDVLKATGAAIDFEFEEAGAEIFKKGDSSGVPVDTIDSIRRTGTVLKGPLETPIGFGEKSANVTLRKLFETYANIRPVYEIPGIKTPFSGRNIDFVVVRENIEDLYAGIEHSQSPGVAQCLKLISRKGSEKIIRFAFELARAEGRKSVHCATKANIMKITEGLFKKTFEDVSKEYPDIAAHHVIIDNCAHQLVRKPEQFEVLVMTNMNGDIISDLASGLVGGLGFAPSLNLGEDIAIFEAVHGSAPDIAGKNIANPTALMLTCVQMLRYLGENQAANLYENALFYTLEEGKHLTSDIAPNGKGISTTEYAKAIIENFGKTPKEIKQKFFKEVKMPKISKDPDFVKVKERKVLGADVFIESNFMPAELGKSLETLSASSSFKLSFISNRGAMVYPQHSNTSTIDCTDVYRCRFLLKDGSVFQENELLTLLKNISDKFQWMHIEKLQEFEGKKGFSAAH